MKTLFIICMLVASTLCWKAYEHGQGPFSNMTNEEFARDYLMSLDDAPNEAPPVFNKDEFEASCPINSTFNWKNTTQAKCIHPIRDQGRCGSCWSFATTEVLSDRYCLDTGDEKIIFSPQYMVDCANETWEAEGCDGAETQTILKWMEEYGAVTDSCYPYYSGTTEKAGVCQQQCTCGQEWKVFSVLKNSTKLYFNYTNCEIAQEIQKNGPVYFSMVVFADFKDYSGGIYHPISYDALGTHAVKCFGWGYDSAELSYYWICANSWSSSWGEEGFFRIGFNDFIGYKAGSVKFGGSSIQNPFISVKSILA